MIPMLPGALLEANLSKEHSAHPQCPGSTLAQFLELRGRRIFGACGALWYTVPGRFLMSLPYQKMLDPDPEELRRMIREAGACGARFPSLNWTGLESGLYVLRRRALRYHVAACQTQAESAARAAALRGETGGESPAAGPGLCAQPEHHGPPGPLRPRVWRAAAVGTTCGGGFRLPGVSFPAVFSGSRMAAYMVTCREQKWLHILHQMSRQEDLPNFPNHLLTYTVTAQAAADTSLEAVCYGYVPLFAADGLHEYKLALRLRNGSSLLGDSTASRPQGGAGPSSRAGRGAGGAALATR